MDAIQILDNAIAKINSMRNISTFQGSGVMQEGERVRSIAMSALIQIRANQYTIDNLKHISFGKEHSDRLIVSAEGFGALMSRHNEIYQTGVQMIVGLLKQERDIRAERLEKERQNQSLRYSKIAIIVSIISVIVSVLVALFK